MNKLFLFTLILLFGALGFAVVRRTAFSSGPQIHMNYSSETLQLFQGEWSAAGAGGISAEFKGRSLRLVAASRWRTTYSISGLQQFQRKQLLVVDDGRDSLIYRFEGDDVLWLEIKQAARPDADSVRFERVLPPD